VERFEALLQPDTPKGPTLSSSIPKSWTFFPMLWLSTKHFVPLLPSYVDNAIQERKEKLA